MESAMRRRAKWRRRVAPLPLQAVYTLAELARASSLSRKRLVRLLERIGIRTMRSGTLILVPLSELEEKAWPFWESIRTAEALRNSSDR
jgi:hypothetical protein